MPETHLKYNIVNTVGDMPKRVCFLYEALPARNMLCDNCTGLECPHQIPPRRSSNLLVPTDRPSHGKHAEDPINDSEPLSYLLIAISG